MFPTKIQVNSSSVQEKKQKKKIFKVAEKAAILDF